MCHHAGRLDSHSRGDRRARRHPAHLDHRRPPRLPRLHPAHVWDGNENLSVEVPLGDFFCNGNAQRVNVVAAHQREPPGGFNSLAHAVPRSSEDHPREPAVGGHPRPWLPGELLPDGGPRRGGTSTLSGAARSLPESVLSTSFSTGSGKGARVAPICCGASSPMAGGARAKSSSSTATARTPPGVAPARRTTSAEPGASVRPFTAPFMGHRCGSATMRTCRSTGSTAGTSWTDPLRPGPEATVQALGWWPDGADEPLTDDISSVGYCSDGAPQAFPATTGVAGALPALVERHAPAPRFGAWGLEPRVD